MEPPGVEFGSHVPLPAGVTYVAAIDPDNAGNIRVYVALPRSKSFISTTLTATDKTSTKYLKKTLGPLNAVASNTGVEPLRALLSTVLLLNLDPDASSQELSDLILSFVAKAHGGDCTIKVQSTGNPRVRSGFENFIPGR